MTISNLQVFDIKRFSTHDGQGIRTTVFLKGCPLRCKWCQNPEGLRPKRQILYMENKCIHCLSCVHACQSQGVTYQDGQLCLNRYAEEDWESIVDACPTRALQFDSSSYSVSEIMEEIKKDESFFRYGGGVTISGGEPFLQPDGLLSLLIACKEEGIHTAIETSLYVDQKWLRKALPYLDQIYADCKVFDSNQHKKWTGVHNSMILDNIRYLLTSEKKDQVIVRTPLIPTMTATKENISQISAFLTSIYPDVHYEILNYNPLAKSKYAYLDMEYCFDDNPKLYSSEVMNEFYQVAKENGIQNLIIE